ncbi:hypothetical protein GCM10008905_27970 [Clostridium malenominatum]|uniref:Uncharacterized protein n=1 Tax=Clostridium malenominatum TaxID=1539 RepID=A0ABN1J5M7_9CLOT
MGNIPVGVFAPRDFDQSISQEIIPNVDVIYDNASQQSTMPQSIINSYYLYYEVIFRTKKALKINYNFDYLSYNKLAILI